MNAQRPPNRLSFLLLLLLLLLPPLATANRARKVFAHYLPWYDSSAIQYPLRTGWCYPVGGTYDCSDPSIIHYSNAPLIGEYSLFDPDVLEYHLLTAFTAGIDGFIINLNPANPMQRRTTVALFDVINAFRAKYPTFLFSAIISYDDGGSADAAEINSSINYVYYTFYNNPAFSSVIFRDDVTGHPVVLAWSESLPSLYSTLFDNIFTGGVILLIRNAVNFEYSTGNFEWVGELNTGLPKTESANWGEQYFEDFDFTMARQSATISLPSDVNTVKMGGVYPGFDDSNVSPFWNNGPKPNRYHLRTVDQGETMALTWNKQLQYTPQRLGGLDVVENPWIQIATWNDWPEGTSIEPATEATYGYTALETNQDYIAQFKSISPAYSKECLRVPYEIFQLRKADSAANAESRAASLMSGVCFPPSGGSNGPDSDSDLVDSSSSSSSSPSPSPDAPPASMTPSVSPSPSTSILPSPSSSATPSITPSVTPSVTPSPSPRGCICTCAALNGRVNELLFMERCRQAVENMSALGAQPGFLELVSCNKHIDMLCQLYARLF